MAMKLVHNATKFNSPFDKDPDTLNAWFSEEYCRAAGGPALGMLLLVLDRRWRTSRLRIDGRLWVYVSLVELAENLSCDYATAKRMVRRLEGAGLVQTASYYWREGGTRKLYRVLCRDFMKPVDTPDQEAIRAAIRKINSKIF